MGCDCVNSPLLLHCSIVTEHVLYFACLSWGPWIRLLHGEGVLAPAACSRSQPIASPLSLSQGISSEVFHPLPTHRGSTAAACLASKEGPTNPDILFSLKAAFCRKAGSRPCVCRHRHVWGCICAAMSMLTHAFLLRHQCPSVGQTPVLFHKPCF